MSKNILKAWLADNTVTTENTTDQIFQLETTRSIDKQVILDRMVGKNPGVRRETMSLAMDLMEEVVSEALMNGESVNTGLYRAVAQFRGTATNGAWDPAKCSIYVSFTQGKALRQAIADTTVDVLGLRPTKFYIGNGMDAETRATDFSATAGCNYTLYGKNIKLAGDDPTVGITLTDADGTETRIEMNKVALNEASRIIFFIPAGLEDGEYTLTVTTQYKGAGDLDLLKTPRTTSQSLYIGTAPTTGGGGEEEGGEDDNQSGSPL